MRTTIDIEDHILRQLKEKAHRTGRPLKKVVNDALLMGLSQARRPRPTKRYRTRTYSMGYPPKGNLDKALEIAMVLQDEEIARKLRLRK
ncbi:MAG: DUF2191 domain-containing protein [Deltaproteobacteria bacterium]|nr:DUF2191 domain-containing protein [Deltaproteobacteria bacterium]MBW1950343.1 DUF2191 domain-containing protein [Deltaproteobacteria bacterium]MBW2103909.1 DUF2191 domain-containing protein [Deltaproteobacteria bacterium]MBW2349341.1 DUF2191 domain-containing protein [Deltaproteobacteria bacterium]RLC10782.1 MAG: DUF2191 domain-containing protein [Deltaproteobacteria bacterium]